MPQNFQTTAVFPRGVDEPVLASVILPVVQPQTNARIKPDCTRRRIGNLRTGRALRQPLVPARKQWLGSRYHIEVTLLELPIPHPGDDPELAELASRARTGSVAAFDALAGRVRDRVRRWAARLTHDDDDAEDVAQLVLLRLHERVGEFEGRSRFTTWLYLITRNVVLSRKITARRRSTLLSGHASELDMVAEPDSALGGDHAEYVARLARACVTDLTPQERKVFEMCDLRGTSAADAANEIGVKAVTVRVLLTKARRRIRLRMLAEHPQLLEDYRK